MIYFIILLAIIVGGNALDKDYREKVMREIQETVEKCAKETNASPDDIAELIAYNFPPSTHEAKCIIACFYKSYKMMREDGTFDKATTINTFSEIKTMDPVLYEKVIGIINKCDDNMKIFDDHCETASAMATCAKNEAHALGLNEDVLMA